MKNPVADRIDLDSCLWVPLDFDDFGSNLKSLPDGYQLLQPSSAAGHGASG